MIYRFVYSTPCEGKVTGVMRLGSKGYPEMIASQNLGGHVGGLHPDLPTGNWLPLPNLGEFETPAEMSATLNEREGWSLVEGEG